LCPGADIESAAGHVVAQRVVHQVRGQALGQVGGLPAASAGASGVCSVRFRDSASV
jgi:Cu/Zn superoxide dismutase